MEKHIGWKIREMKDLGSVNVERGLLQRILTRKANCFGHILR